MTNRRDARDCDGFGLFNSKVKLKQTVGVAGRSGGAGPEPPDSAKNYAAIMRLSAGLDGGRTMNDECLIQKWRGCPSAGTTRLH